MEFTSRIMPVYTYYAMLQQSFYGYGGMIDLNGNEADRINIASIWWTPGKIDAFVAGWNPYNAQPHAYDSEGSGVSIGGSWKWQMQKPYMMAWRRFIVPGADTKVLYSAYHYDPYREGTWAYLGTFRVDRPASSYEINMGGIGGFCESPWGDYLLREFDIRNVWALKLDDTYELQDKFSTHGYNAPANAGVRSWPISGGWRMQAYASTNEPVVDQPMLAGANEPVPIPYFINCGEGTDLYQATAAGVASDQVATSAIRGFEPDAYYSGSSGVATTTASIDLANRANVAGARLYQSCRYGSDFTYKLAGLKPNKPIRLRLHYCEPAFDNAGTRMQRVSVNGYIINDNFDVVATAGGKNKALVMHHQVTAGADGVLNIRFQGLRDYAMVSGIEASYDLGGFYGQWGYRIRSTVNPNSVMTMYYNQPTTGHHLELWYDSPGTTPQRYYITPAGPGTYHIRPITDISKFIGVRGNSAAAGAAIEVQQYTGLPSQIWKLNEGAQGTHWLEPQNAPGMCIVSSWLSGDAGRDLHIWPYTESALSERWFLEIE